MNAPCPRLVAWELTRRCNLRCRHCRASAGDAACEGELSLPEGRRLVDAIAGLGSPVLILTGGEPLLCPWVFDIAEYARGKSLRPAMGTNATLIDEAVAKRIASAGIGRISVSIDFPDAVRHDGFRASPGAFDAALRGIRAAQEAGIEVQINSTVTKTNKATLAGLHDLAVSVGAKAFHPFLLVPTGRGKKLAGEELSADECEEVLTWICRRSADSPLELKPTDAPQYQRVLRQQCAAPSLRSRGCLAGTGFCFIGHTGDVKPCGYFDLAAGNVRERSFGEIWRESPLFDDLRHPERLKGKCGECEYKGVCGGCRARAFAKTGDYLSEEPICAHVTDARLVAALQTEFPVAERPYAVLGKRLGLDERTCFGRVLALVRGGLVSRIGASFDSRRLGYVSTLACADADAAAVERVSAVADACAGVTHNYLRGGSPNLWFTVTAGTQGEIERLLSEISSIPGVRGLKDFPAVKTYKINSVFGAASGGRAPVAPRTPSGEGRIDRALVRKLQGDISGLGLSPFAPDEIPVVESYLADGTMRRLGAFVDHRRAGAAENALTAWTVPQERLDAAGEAFAAQPFVSHCYARSRPPGWPHNLWAMVHAGDAAEMERRISSLRALAEVAAGGRAAFETFPTLRELKKTPMRYFMEDERC